MSTASDRTTAPAPEKPAGLADRVDSAVDKVQTKVDSAIDAAQERVRSTGDELTRQSADARKRAIEHALNALDAAQAAMDQAIRKAKDALQA